MVRTIGGHITFPAHRKDGFRINQARGVNRKISHRFDLTLECIKRFHKNGKSYFIFLLMILKESHYQKAHLNTKITKPKQ